jgi:hypothetical protein
MGALEPGADNARPVFEGFPEVESPDAVVLAPSTQTAPMPTPQQYLQYLYDEDE